MRGLLCAYSTLVFSASQLNFEVLRFRDGLHTSEGYRITARRGRDTRYERLLRL